MLLSTTLLLACNRGERDHQPTSTPPPTIFVGGDPPETPTLALGVALPPESVTTPVSTPTPTPEPAPEPTVLPTTVPALEAVSSGESASVPPLQTGATGGREDAVYNLLIPYCRDDDVRGCLAHYAGNLVAIADEYGIDWRLLPAIAVHESSGGLHACDYNAWGYGSCKGYNFFSWVDGARASAELLVQLGALDDPYYSLRVWVAGGQGAAAGGGITYADKVWSTMLGMITP